jgi:hypothetical protein
MATMRSLLTIGISFLSGYLVAVAATGLLFVFGATIYDLTKKGPPNIAWSAFLFYPVALLFMGLWISLFVAYVAFIPSVLAASALQLLRATNPIAHAIAAGCVAAATTAYLDAYGPFYLGFNETWPMIPCGVVAGFVYWKIWSATMSNWPSGQPHPPRWHQKGP